MSRKDRYPRPRIDYALNTILGPRYFSSLDVRSSYWQVRLPESVKQKTGFVPPDGPSQFNEMTFVLCNTPATFERMRDCASGDEIACLCCLDDIIGFPFTFEQHLERSSEILSSIAKACNSIQKSAISKCKAIVCLDI